MARTLSQRMTRKTPLAEVGKQIEEGDHLARSIGLFQLTMFGVGATIGTGIFSLTDPRTIRCAFGRFGGATVT